MIKLKRLLTILALLAFYAGMVAPAWSGTSYYVDSSAIIQGTMTGTFGNDPTGNGGEWLRQDNTGAKCKFIQVVDSTHIQVSGVVGAASNCPFGAPDNTHPWRGMTSGPASNYFTPDGSSAGYPVYKGNNSYTGKAPTYNGVDGPWQTLAYANSYLNGNQAGNTLYLIRGCAYVEHCWLNGYGTGTGSNMLTVDAWDTYGLLASDNSTNHIATRPQIVGSVPIFGADWTSVGGYTNPIYSCSLPSAFEDVGLSNMYSASPAASNYGVLTFGSNGTTIYGGDYAWTKNYGGSFVTSLTTLGNNPGTYWWSSGTLYFCPPTSGNGSGNPTSNGTIYWAATSLADLALMNTGAANHNYIAVGDINLYFGSSIGSSFTCNFSGTIGAYQSSYSTFQYMDLYFGHYGFNLGGQYNNGNYLTTHYTKATGFYTQTGSASQSPQSSNNTFNYCTFADYPETASNSINPEWGPTAPWAMNVLGYTGATLSYSAFNNMTISGNYGMVFYINAYPNDHVTVNGCAVTGSVFNANTSYLVYASDTTGYLILNGITYSQTSGAPQYAMYFNSVTGLTVSNCNIAWGSSIAGDIICMGTGTNTNWSFLNNQFAGYLLTDAIRLGGTTGAGTMLVQGNFFNMNNCSTSHGWSLYTAGTWNSGTTLNYFNNAVIGSQNYNPIYMGAMPSTTNICNNAFYNTGAYTTLKYAADTTVNFINNVVHTGSLIQTPSTQNNLTSSNNIGYNLADSGNGWAYTTAWKTLAQWQALKNSGGVYFDPAPSQVTNPYLVSTSAPYDLHLTSASVNNINKGYDVGFTENTPDIGLPYAGRGGLLPF